MKRFVFTRRHRNILLAAFGILAAVLVFYLLARAGFGVPCLFFRITGLQCPGCGNSRAVLALLRLDLGVALSYNMLFPLEIFYIGWVLFHCCRSYLRGGPFGYKPPLPWLDIACLAAVLLWWVLRNLLP